MAVRPHRVLRLSPAPIWGALALAAGVVAGLAPTGWAIGGLLAAALGVLVIVEPALALVLMLALAPLKTLVATEAPGLLPADPGLLMFALAIGAWMVWRARVCHTIRALPRSPVYVPLVAILLAFGPSVAGAAAIGDWVTELAKWVAMLLLVPIVRDLGRGSRWQWIAFGAVWAGVLQAVIGLYQYFGGSGAAHLWIANFQRFRAFGSFGQPNPFSALMGMTLPLALGLGWGYARRAVVLRRRSAWRGPALLALIYGVSAGILTSGLIASWGRGAWLGFGAALLVMVCFAAPRWWQSAGLAVALSGGLLIVWSLGLIPAGIAARLTSAAEEFIGFRDVRGVPVTNANYPILERLAHWQAALAMADAHPLIGVGLGNYAAAYPQYSLIGWPDALGHAHNEYLTILAETGVVGLVGYVGGGAAIFYWTARQRRQNDRVLAGLMLGLLGVWTHVAVHSVVDKLTVNNLHLHIGVLLGLLAIGIAQGSSSDSNEYSSDESAVH